MRYLSPARPRFQFRAGTIWDCDQDRPIPEDRARSLCIHFRRQRLAAGDRSPAARYLGDRFAELHDALTALRASRPAPC